MQKLSDRVAALSGPDLQVYGKSHRPLLPKEKE